MERHSISVHFSDNYNDCYTAYKYVTKMDEEAVHSEGHPDLKLALALKTGKAIATWRRSAKQKRHDAETESASVALTSLKTSEKPLKHA